MPYEGQRDERRPAGSAEPFEAFNPLIRVDRYLFETARNLTWSVFSPKSRLVFALRNSQPLADACEITAPKTTLL
ncbi:hypothetical protein ELH21_31160 (plasmid) [Rhizobium leguminosarum]|nr:hypothetical protein ELH21_31160 [Rhizobium leguminosarum]